MDIQLSEKFLEKLKEEILNTTINSQEEALSFKKKYLERGTILDNLTSKIKDVPKDFRPKIGKLINEIKQLCEQKIKDFNFAYTQDKKQENLEDPTLPVHFLDNSGFSPITIVISRILNILEGIGYILAEGPELEDDWHNFTALNFPEEHPARDMQDTIFIADTSYLLRTHTSNVQIRTLEKTPPPLKIVCPGKVYRNERISARAHFQFHQIEGLYVDKDVSFANLKYDITYLCNEFFGKGVQLRFRPSFFPFTEPSAEVDISCLVCNGKGCPLCKGSGWVEVMGAGIVNPAVLKNCGISPDIWSGFAFGLGVERFAMLLFKIPDIRLFYENYLLFIKQFNNVLIL